MITSQGMLVCSFNLKQRFSRGEENVYPLNQQYELKLENETLRIEDAAKFFQIFCQENSKFTDDTIKMKLFSVKENSFCKIVHDTYTAVSFVIKSGGYGVEGEITDRTSQVVTYHRKENESDVKEFLCVVYIPHDIGNLQIKKGILVFQSIGAYGVKTITTERLRDFFGKFDLTFETRSVSIASFIEKLIQQGSLYKLTLIRERVSQNPADNMLIATGREERVFIRPTLKPEWKLKLLTMFQHTDETGVFEIPEGEDYDDISIQFKLGERTRTMRLRNIERLSIVEEIPETLVRERSADKIRNYMISTADMYKERMVWGNRGEI